MEVKIQKLIEEYKINVDLWKHDDNLRQQRNRLFLSVNTIIFALLAGTLSANYNVFSIIIAFTPLSFLGLLTCILWYKTHKRNKMYILLRRYQLLKLENEIKDISSVKNQVRWLDNYLVEKIPKTYDEFVQQISLKRSSTLKEGMLPLILIVLWCVIAIIGIVLILSGKINIGR